MARQNPPIYLVGGSKGGVGKSFVTLALVDYLQRTDINVVLVETDTSNPDVMKAVHAEIECASCNLDDVSGWIDFVNFCDTHRDAIVVVNTAARSQAGVEQYGGTLASALDELARRLVVLWVINRQRDSLELLLKFGATFPNAITYVVRNGYFGSPDKFTLYRDSQLRNAVEAQGQSLDFPDLADRVADELRSQRLSVGRAAQTMHIGERAELLRWRAIYGTMFAKLTAHAQLAR
ncbi:protein mobD [Burkholderia cepacia]|uniref:nucleotide-binding protein n=1 Tax=Burkholderia cepacia TaxID=292 RepID=UPI00075D4C2E|nr:protein mobD [Burkholderia cepacia]KVA51613.1 protein mobD [Burkholderia cepacia]KVA57206.1 protein mobD [Burkholderia cepacia]KVA60577.1 protein mobD [Burkholderia cepacia]KVA85054.1 protein mobD [Burkholderia cepacia]KVA88352.1 protein mobD [Burkholderia cepacia]